MNPTRLPYFTDAFWKSGNSALHGPHHEAHLFTTTGCPRSAARRALYASGPPPSSWFACSCRSPSGAGAPASSFAAREAVGAALFGVSEPPEPACERPIATTATSATVPSAIQIRFTFIGWQTRSRGGAGGARAGRSALTRPAGSYIRSGAVNWTLSFASLHGANLAARGATERRSTGDERKFAPWPAAPHPPPVRPTFLFHTKATHG